MRYECEHCSKSFTDADPVIWLLMILTGGVKREMVQVDESGVVTVSKAKSLPIR